MKLWKYIALLGGIAGLVGFFVPFVEFHARDHALSGSVSAYQIVRGIDDISEMISGAGPALASDDQLRQWATEFNRSMAEYRGAMVGFFIPAVLLALLGALTGIRRKMGRLAGLGAILFGGASAGVWALFQHVSEEQSRGDVIASLGIGLHLLLAAGAAGVLAGLGALVIPDRGD